MQTGTDQNQMQNDVATATSDDVVVRLEELCRELMQFHRDPASVAIAGEITSIYQSLSTGDRTRFLMTINNNFGVDSDEVIAAAKEYERDPCLKNHQALSRVVEAPRQKLFRCINTAADGLKTLVRMRQDLRQFTIPIRRGVSAVDADLKHLLQSWFNRGFLELERIDWNAPASLLEKLIEYEAVHEIHNWVDLRRRLQADRRCFAFFHPSMKDEPLVFVEVALTNRIADNIESLIAPDAEASDPNAADTAMFYSISSCQPGLLGISFGGLLIKQVVTRLQADLPNVTTFSTLSPVSGFCGWLGQQTTTDHESLRPLIERLQAAESPVTADEIEPHREALMSLLASYLLNAKLNDRPIDSVARFHLGNGAQLRAVHWMADTSGNGLSKSFGMMVNYVYETAQIQFNRQNFLQHKIIAAHPSIHALSQQVKGT